MKKSMREVILEHLKRYPEMEIQDAVKLVFQSEYGGGHMIADPSDSLSRLYKEYQGLKEPVKKQPLAYEPIGNGLVRLHLSGITSHFSLETVNKFFVNTAALVNSDRASFEEKLDILRDMASEGSLPFSAKALEDYLKAYKEKGYPLVRHSAVYRKLYEPAYRVVSEDYIQYAQVFERIDSLLKSSEKDNLLIALEGKCGSGKSYLARLLSGVYPCNVIHMDDFFLRPEQKTEERLLEVGGNVDYERFFKEVIRPIREEKDIFEYQRYNCMQQRLTDSVRVYKKRLNIIEGSYSCHPYFGNCYDLKIFLDLDDELQKERILERNGAYMLSRFTGEWIPKENDYFRKFAVKEHCHMCI